MSAAAVNVAGCELTVMSFPAQAAWSEPSGFALKVIVTCPSMWRRPKGPVQSLNVRCTTSGLVASLTRVTQPAGHSCIAAWTCPAAVPGSWLEMEPKAMLPRCVDCAVDAAASFSSAVVGSVAPLCAPQAKTPSAARTRAEVIEVRRMMLVIGGSLRAFGKRRWRTSKHARCHAPRARRPRIFRGWRGSRGGRSIVQWTHLRGAKPSAQRNARGTAAARGRCPR